MAWLLPELEVGEEPELRPLELELLELLELEDDEPELEDEPELVELEPDEPEFELDDPEFVEVEPVEDEPVDVEEEDVLVVCVDPGRARASAPAVTTLAMVTAVVVDRTCSGRVPWRRWPGGFRLDVRCSCYPFCGHGLGNRCTNLLGNL